MNNIATDTANPGKKRIIQLPVNEENPVSDLRIGDIIFITGILATGRDDVHHRFVDEKIPLPFDLRGGAIFHAGPIITEKNGKHELVSIGPTSSVRMEAWSADFIGKSGVKIMIGKGGMGAGTAADCRAYGAIHCVYPGGCAVLGASQILSVEEACWPDLGMPEALWIMKARELGPLIVSIDTCGNNLFAENTRLYSERSVDCIKPIAEFIQEGTF